MFTPNPIRPARQFRELASQLCLELAVLAVLLLLRLNLPFSQACPSSLQSECSGAVAAHRPSYFFVLPPTKTAFLPACSYSLKSSRSFLLLFQSLLPQALARGDCV